jgi:hypothetical protein
MWGDLWHFPFVTETWATVWQAVGSIGTVGTLTYTLRLFAREQWRFRSAEARRVMIWNESPGASTDDGVHTYHNTVHLVNASARPIHDVHIQVVLPSLREYNKRRKSVPHLDPPSYSRQQWKEPVEPLRDMTKFYWGGSFKESNKLPETVVAGDTRTKDISTPVDTLRRSPGRVSRR